MHSKEDLAPLSDIWYRSFFRSQPLGETTITELLFCRTYRGTLSIFRQYWHFSNLV